MTLHHTPIPYQAAAPPPGGVRLGVNFRGNASGGLDDGENSQFYNDRYPTSVTGDDGQVTRDFGFTDVNQQFPNAFTDFTGAHGDLRLGGISRSQFGDNLRFQWRAPAAAAGTARLRLAMAHNASLSWTYAFEVVIYDVVNAAFDDAIGEIPGGGTATVLHNFVVAGVNGQTNVINQDGTWSSPAAWLADYETSFRDLPYADRGTATGVQVGVFNITNWWGINHFSIEEV